MKRLRRPPPPGLALAVIASTLLLLAAASPAHGAPDYSIQAIRYADVPGTKLSELIVSYPSDETVDTVMVVWLIRGGGHNILFDSGFHRERWFAELPMKNYLRPDEAVKLAGVSPEAVTDIVISHAHWDHLGGIDLFAKATVWIQKEEFHYYTGEAWQAGGDHGGIDPEDVRNLVMINTEGRLRLIDGEDQEILPGIRVYTGARHTYASQYLRVEGDEPYVLASDNCYLYRNLELRLASSTFTAADHAANIRHQAHMIELAGAVERVIPGHDAQQFVRFPSQGRVARVR